MSRRPLNDVYLTIITASGLLLDDKKAIYCLLDVGHVESPLKSSRCFAGSAWNEVFCVSYDFISAIQISVLEATTDRKFI